MAQEGRGKRSSFPDSFFEIDDFDSAWEEEEPSGIEHMREPSLPPDPASVVQPASSQALGQAPCQDDDVVVTFEETYEESPLEDGLPLVVPDAGAAPARADAKPRKGQARGSERATTPGDPLLNEVRDRYAMGDYSGALVIAEDILINDPGNSQARRYADNCRQVLEQMYCAKLGPLTQRPEVVVTGDQLRWLSLDHRAGFLLSLVDGTSSVEELLDISGMPRFEALRTLCDLLEQNVITLA
jgi:hypothetical protein